MTKLLRSPEFTLVVSAVLVAGATALAYSRLGFLGVMLVGLLIMFTAVQSDVQKDGMRRPFVPEKLSRTARIARDADNEGMARFWWRARIIGAVLTTAGLAGFVYLQLPS